MNGVSQQLFQLENGAMVTAHDLQWSDLPSDKSKEYAVVSFELDGLERFQILYRAKAN